MNAIKNLSLVSLILACMSANAADWTIDNSASKLSFLSTKKQNVTEVHHFKQIAGQLTDSGEFSVSVDLASVDTGIDIRNSRMQEFLFDVVNFPKATLTAKIDAEQLALLPVSTSKVINVDAQLALHGETKPLNFDVLVTKVSETMLLVVSAQPFVLNASDYALVEGIEKLREIAKLPSISHAVPISFYLTLDAAK